MKWWKILITDIRKFFKMMELPIIKATGLIDESQVKNVCLHYDGEKYYFTAIVNGSFVYITHSPELELWFKKSGVPVSRFCDIWEMHIPENANFLVYENIPKVIIKTKLAI